MKKILIILLAVFPLVFSSCKKDDHQPGTLTGTLEGFMDKDTKVVYDPSSSDSPFSWQNGDLIKVFRYSGKGNYIAALTDDNSKAEFTFNGTESGSNKDVTDDNAYQGPYYAVYPSSIHSSQQFTTRNGNRVLRYVDVTLNASYNTDANGNLLKNPMFAQSSSPDSKKLPFKHICGLLRLQLQKDGVSIVSIKVTATSAINGKYRLTSNSGIPSITMETTTTVTDNMKSTTMSFASPQDLSSQKAFYIPLPQGDYTNLVIELTAVLGQKCIKTQQSGTLHIQRAMYSTITLGETDLAFTGNIIGAKGGLFSVNSNGKKVRFSKGNLQYLAAATGEYDANTWRFAEHQYDVCSRDANEHPSNTSTEWIDMFGWGTSGYGGSNPYNYLHTETYGPATGGFDESGDQNYDWGHNAISNGGNTQDTWRTLTSSEWNYLTGNNDHRRNRWARAIVNGQRGMILLPDAWPETGEPLNRGAASGSWLDASTINTYSADQWSTLEDNGAVFLPQCGYRTTNNSGTTSISYYNPTSQGKFMYGQYWASNANSSGEAYYSGFSESAAINSHSTSSSEGKWIGRNVRLVHDVD